MDAGGEVSATFDTTWGTLNTFDPFAFPATLEGDVYGEPIPTDNLGALAGSEEGEHVVVVLAANNTLDQMTQIAVILPADAAAGTHVVDLGARPGYVITGSLLDASNWELTAFMGGELILEDYETSPGGAVRGSLEAVLVPNFFE